MNFPPKQGPMLIIPQQQIGPISKFISVKWTCQQGEKFCPYQTPIQWISGLPMQVSFFVSGKPWEEKIYAQIKCAWSRPNWHCLMQFGVKITSAKGEHFMESVFDLPSQKDQHESKLFLFEWDAATWLKYAPNGEMSATISIHSLESWGGLRPTQLPPQENQDNDLAMVNQQLQGENKRLKAQVEEINRALAQKDKERDQCMFEISCLKVSLNKSKEAYVRAQEELQKIRSHSHVKLEDVG